MEEDIVIGRARTEAVVVGTLQDDYRAIMNVLLCSMQL